MSLSLQSLVRYTWAMSIVGLMAFNSSPAMAAAPKGKAPPPNAAEADYYKILTYTIPPGVSLESGALEFMPDGKLAVSTRRGEIYMVENALDDDPAKATFKLYASGLHEVLGLAQKDGWLYCVQRCEVTRMKDKDGDGRADIFETVNDDWGITGNYHEYAFGSKFDKNGDLWVTLCLTGSFTSEIKYRGWCVRITPDGKMVPTCSGLRSPGGMGMNAQGEMFFTDNQGPWNGACCLKHLKPGSFQGHPDGNKWYSLTDAIGPRPMDPVSGSRIAVEAKRIKEFVPPAVIYPYKLMGQSASGFAADVSVGKFGPFSDQLFTGDQTYSTLMRTSLEEVNGVYQGACYPFREGFGSGNLPVTQAPDGSLIVGGTNRGWGSRGNKPFALERLVWTGKTPFEVKEMKAKPDGFELTFTEAVDPAAAGNVSAYTMRSFCYIFQKEYGSPEVDETKPVIEEALVAADAKSVHLKVKGLVEGHIHDLKLDGVRSQAGAPLLHPQAYYTLNQIPKK